MARTPTPPPDELAGHLRKVARTLDTHGPDALSRAEVLAARGYPTDTGSDGTRGANTAGSAVENAALASDRWAGVDDRLDNALRVLHASGIIALEIIADVLAHASDDDPLPAGSGPCVCCSTSVRPSPKKKDHRLKAGLCPPCHAAWQRWKRDRPEALRPDFMRNRRAALAAQPVAS